MIVTNLVNITTMDREKFDKYVGKFGPWVLVGVGLAFSYFGNCENYKAYKEAEEEMVVKQVKNENPDVVGTYTPLNLGEVKVKIKKNLEGKTDEN